MLRADLHIHTCLSPCAEREMSPPAVVRRAREKGLDVIAVCDHNSAENVEAVSRAAEGTGLAVIGGMEVTSREEVHVLGLFAESGQLAALQKVVYDHLPGENDVQTFGEQLVVDEGDRVVGHNPRLLIGATELSLAAVVRTIRESGGLAVAAHVDRPSFSVISQLGFIPKGLRFDALEVCSDRVPELPGELPVIFSSDAHRWEEIGVRNTGFRIEEGSASEMGMALRGERGREVVRP